MNSDHDIHYALASVLIKFSLEVCMFLYLAFAIILQIPELKEIILLGFYQSSEILSKFIASAQQEFNVPIRYLNINN